MRALVIAPQPFFSPRGTPFSVYYRALIASELGVKIDLLTYGEGQDVNIPNLRIIRIPKFSFLGNVTIGPSYQKLFLDIFLFIWTIGLLLKNRYHFVHAHEEAVFFCRFLKLIFHFKLVYDMHSSLPQQLTNFHFTKSKVLHSLFTILEQTSLKAANAVITICPELSLYVKDIIYNSENIFLIENSIIEPVKLLPGSDENMSNAKSSDHKAKKMFKPLPGKKIIVYAGTLEPYQGIEILLGAFQFVIKEIQNAFLLIVGGQNEQLDHYKSVASKNGIAGSVHFTGRVSQAVARHYCSLASVLVSPRVYGTNTPLKVYEQLASGIPLVATNIDAHTQVLDNDVAILVEPNPEDMGRGILSALSSVDDCTRISRNAQIRYREKYARPVYAEKMREVLEKMTG